MTFHCTMARRSDGQWVVRHSDSGLGSFEVAAPSRDQALEKMRSELRYRLELCPCTGEQYKDLEIELVE
ncbi:MAG: hypothetical protein HY290_01325 [Planctomycetia bacterium]|nr:hypothetical protein [Planctomycetia bacterium]